MSLPLIYTIRIDNPGPLAAPADGFIDDLTTEKYGINPDLPSAHARSTGYFPATEEEVLAKARANMRWEQIVLSLSELTQLTILNTQAVGATESDNEHG